MLHFGFTGTQHGMTEEQKQTLRTRLAIVGKAGDVFHHGDCIGADAEACEIAREMGFRIVQHPPLDDSKRAFTRADEVREPKAYLDRNHDIVNESMMLFVCPRTAKEELRSGTWATYRYAKTTTTVVNVIYP